MEEVVGSIPTRSTKFLKQFAPLRSFPFCPRCAWHSGSGFRRAAQTPRKRLAPESTFRDTFLLNLYPIAMHIDTVRSIVSVDANVRRNRASCPAFRSVGRRCFMRLSVLAVSLILVFSPTTQAQHSSGGGGSSGGGSSGGGSSGGSSGGSYGGSSGGYSGGGGSGGGYSGGGSHGGGYSGGGGSGGGYSGGGSHGGGYSGGGSSGSHGGYSGGHSSGGSGSHGSGSSGSAHGGNSSHSVSGTSAHFPSGADVAHERAWSEGRDSYYSTLPGDTPAVRDHLLDQALAKIHFEMPANLKVDQPVRVDTPKHKEPSRVDNPLADKKAKSNAETAVRIIWPKPCHGQKCAPAPPPPPPTRLRGCRIEGCHLNEYGWRLPEDVYGSIQDNCWYQRQRLAEAVSKAEWLRGQQQVACSATPLSAECRETAQAMAKLDSKVTRSREQYERCVFSRLRHTAVFLVPQP